MKQTFEITPNFGAVYAAALYPDLAKIFQLHGYALAVHGSLARDFDLIAVPWAEAVSTPEKVMEEVTATIALRLIGKPETRNHGRVAYTLSVGFGECAVDLSFLHNAGSDAPGATEKP